MGEITSLFAHKVVAQARPSVEKGAFLKTLGLAPDAPIDPKVMVRDTEYYRFFADMARADPNGVDLPLRVGATMRCDDYGAFGLAWKSAPRLLGSYQRAERYARVLTSVATYEVREAPEGFYMHLHREGDRGQLGLRLSNEATIASIAAISQEVATSGFQAEAVFFKHAPPDTVAAHERHFGCAVHFDSGMDALLIAAATMHAPNKVGDAGIVEFLDSHLDAELKKFNTQMSFEHRVRRQIAQSLSEGIPGVAEVAGYFNMSGRTLQRRLADSGFSFKSLVDHSRRDLARQLLKDTAYSLAEVAFLTGFSEQSAFNRAFKRWEGQTPRSYRLKPMI